MSTAKRKRTIRRRQKGPLQSRGSRRGSTGGAARRSRSTRARRGSSGASAGSTSGTTPGRRSSSPAVLTRSQGSRNVASGRPTTRRERANARASTNPVLPQVRNAAAPTASPSTHSTANSTASPSNAKQATAGGKPKRDFVTGRTLFPVESGGKTQYLPTASDATAAEQQRGLFVTDASVQKEAVNTLLKPDEVKRTSVRDFNTGRTLFATKTAAGKTQYLPKQSEATALELSQGKYVPNVQVEVSSKGNEVLNQLPVFDFNGQRNLYATKTTDNRSEYLPRKSDANAFELSQGRFIEDKLISVKAPMGAENAMSPRPPRYDVGRGRQVYAVETPDGTRYLPRESEASGLERAQGLFVPDDVVDRHERKRLRMARWDDSAAMAQRRAQRAATLPAGIPSRQVPLPGPVTEASDGTALWDGVTPPAVSDEKQRETLKNLRPKYDIGKGRLVYPTETARGKIEYLPLLEDASSQERVRGLYAALVPPEPLEDFLAEAEVQGNIVRETFRTDRGDIQAYSQAAIEEALEQAPTLVLRSAQMVSDSAQAVPVLQQQVMNSPPP